MLPARLIYSGIDQDIPEFEFLGPCCAGFLKGQRALLETWKHPRADQDSMQTAAGTQSPQDEPTETRGIGITTKYLQTGDRRGGEWGHPGVGFGSMLLPRLAVYSHAPRPPFLPTESQISVSDGARLSMVCNVKPAALRHSHRPRDISLNANGARDGVNGMRHGVPHRHDAIPLAVI